MVANITKLQITGTARQTAITLQATICSSVVLATTILAKHQVMCGKHIHGVHTAVNMLSTTTLKNQPGGRYQLAE